MLTPLLALLLGAADTAEAESSCGNRPSFHLAIHDVAGLKPFQISETLTSVRRLFGNAGICMTSSVCLPGQRGRCPTVDHPSLYIVHLLLQEPMPVEGEALAFALPMQGFGRQAVLLQPQIARFAEQYRGIVDTKTVLTYTIAHELAHLITGTRDHSRGIMARSWRYQDLPKMQYGQLQFEPDCAAAMRVRLIRARE